MSMLAYSDWHHNSQNKVHYIYMKLIQLTTQPADALFSRVQVARELSGLLFVRSEIDCSQVEK